MAVTEATLAIEHLSTADGDAGLALSRETNWNQTREDWLLIFDRGIVFGIRDDDGRVIATAALLPSPPVTWISMVLVTAAHRRRGLADRLMRRCIDEAKDRGWQPWLDATAAGAAVYCTLDFVETGFGMRRMRRPASVAAKNGASARDAHDVAGVDALLAADHDVMRSDRSTYVRALAGRSGSKIHRCGAATALVRDGDRARHIGPVFASDEDNAIALVDDILSHESGPLLIDIADDRLALIKWCEDRGFMFERSFSRMRLGASGEAPRHDRLMVVAGPEFG